MLSNIMTLPAARMLPCYCMLTTCFQVTDYPVQLVKSPALPCTLFGHGARICAIQDCKEGFHGPDRAHVDLATLELTRSVLVICL